MFSFLRCLTLCFLVGVNSEKIISERGSSPDGLSVIIITRPSPFEVLYGDDIPISVVFGNSEKPDSDMGYTTWLDGVNVGEVQHPHFTLPDQVPGVHNITLVLTDKWNGHYDAAAMLTVVLAPDNFHPANKRPMFLASRLGSSFSSGDDVLSGVMMHGSEQDKQKKKNTNQ